MKKLFSLMLVVAMVLSLGACAEKKDPATLYAEAWEKMSTLTDVEMQANVDMTMEMLGMSMDMKSSVDMKGQGVTAENPVLDMKIKTSVLGEEIDMQTWYTDGYYYLDMMDTKMKMAMPIEEAMKQIEGGATSEAIPKEAFKEITAVKEDKNTVITYIADGAQMSEQIKKSMSTLEDMQMDLDEISMAVEDVSGTFTISPDGYIIAQTMETVIKMTMGEIAEGVEGDEITMKMKMDNTYTNPGQPVTVTLPEDLDSYMEIDNTGIQ